ncbi:50S ribosomal protein L28 [Paenibacillus sp. J2TS4]|uniref:50S ribosomal protein L28 n=1 Tax=Paenibacillus sp. J2TS4 TaxID=2807194 RepID=UPI001BCFCDBD|nr:50S ribosomal protein L28 [Paenibacillus sp. J2TS4]
MKCNLCGKRTVAANRISLSRSHVSRRSKRVQKPNIVKRKMLIDGQPMTLSLCTKCLRTLNKQGRHAARK